MEKFNAATGLRCSVNPRCNMAGYREIAPLKKKSASLHHRRRPSWNGSGPGWLPSAAMKLPCMKKRKLAVVMHEAAFDLSVKEDIQILINYYVAQMEKLVSCN